MSRRSTTKSKEKTWKELGKEKSKKMREEL